MTQPTGENVEICCAATISHFDVAGSEFTKGKMRYWNIQIREQRTTGISFLGFGSLQPRDAPVIVPVHVKCNSADKTRFDKIKGGHNPIHFRSYDLVRLSLPKICKSYIGFIVEDPEVKMRRHGSEDWIAKIYFNSAGDNIYDSIQKILQSESKQDAFLYKIQDMNISEEVFEVLAMLSLRDAPLELKLAYSSPVEYYRNLNARKDWILRELGFRNMSLPNQGTMLTSEGIFNFSFERFESDVIEKEISLKVVLNNNQKNVLIHGGMFHELIRPLMNDEDSRARVFRSTQKHTSNVWGTTINFVHGPPGIGKSNIARLLIRSVASKHNGRVLVLSVTNDAVDDLMEKVYKEWNHSSSSSLLRLGNNSSRSIGQDNELRKLMRETKKPTTYFLNQKRVLFGTLNAVMHIRDWNNISSFETIIIEECAYAEPTLVFAVLRMVTGKSSSEIKIVPRIYLIGDHRQLPPYRSKDLEKLAGRFTPWFFEKGASLKLPADYPAWTVSPTHQLQIQYRMNSKISSLVSDLLYDGTLKCAIPDEERTWFKKNLLQEAYLSSSHFQQVTMVDHSKYPEHYRQHAYSGEVKNSNEAELVNSIIHQLKNRNEKLVENILVLSPYNAQVIALRKIMRRFSVDDPHKACVAMSRSRELLIVVGAIQVISEKSEVWKNVFHWVRQKAGNNNRRSGVTALQPASLTSTKLVYNEQYYNF